MRLDLTAFKTEADLNRLLAFAKYLAEVNSINMAKVMALFTSYR